MRVAVVASAQIFGGFQNLPPLQSLDFPAFFGLSHLFPPRLSISVIFDTDLVTSHQRSTDETPYWRTLKANGELNPKYPGGAEAQKVKLEAEGHTIIKKGRTNIRYFVKDYEAVRFELF